MEYVGNIKYDDKLYEDRKYIIYGCGINGKKIFDYLKLIGKEKNVYCFCDQKNIEIGKERGVNIIAPHDAIQIANVDFLVAGKYEHEMVQYLLENGVTRIHLISVSDI